MDMTAFDAILFPADGRLPHLVSLMTSPIDAFMQTSALIPSTPALSANLQQLLRGGLVPHPEMYMNWIAEGLGPRSWHFKVPKLAQNKTDRTDRYPGHRKA